MNNTSIVKGLNADLAEMRNISELGEVLSRLEANSDWKKLIDEEYLKNEAVRLVHLLASPNMQGKEMQETILGDIRAIGAFRAFLQKVATFGHNAKSRIPEIEAELEMVNGEDYE